MIRYKTLWIAGFWFVLILGGGILLVGGTLTNVITTACIITAFLFSVHKMQE